MKYSNYDILKKRLSYQGGFSQERRMIKDKYDSFLRALNYSYQSSILEVAQKREEIPLLNQDRIEGERSVNRCQFKGLVTPNKLKEDYDIKNLSAEYRLQLRTGDILFWGKTGTHWIITLEEMTEDAYFRGIMKKCNYRIKFKDSEGRQRCTWASVRGPVETQLKTINKQDVLRDIPNLTLNIILPANEITKNSFKRYQKFLLNNKCWEIVAFNDINSNNGILELNCREYYINKEIDDIKNNLKDGFVLDEATNSDDSFILGSSVIKPMIKERYTTEMKNGRWNIDSKKFPRVDWIVEKDNSLIVNWTKSISGSFEIEWISSEQKIFKKHIKVESLF